MSSRRSPDGPERELINRFLEKNLLRIPRGCRLTIFREPRIPSGFPDLVLVIWKESIARNWVPSRAEIQARDVRLMHQLLTTDWQQPSMRCDTRIKSSLERLEAAEMIRKSGNKWSARPLSVTFAAQCIIAIEAKVKEWRGALDQAVVNTWFASCSYVLVPHIPKRSQLLQQAASMGVGVLTQDALETDLACTRSWEPRSYVSWMFNEWAWRSAQEMQRRS